MTGPEPAAVPAPPPAGGPRWLMHPHAIVRSTGFPWRLLDVLDHPLTAAGLDELERCEAARAEAVTAVVAAARAEPDALSPADSRRLRRALSRRGAPPDDVSTGSAGLRAALDRSRAAAGAVVAAEEALRQAFARETEAVHRALVDVAADPAVREAVWLSSPTMHDRGLAELAGLAGRPHSGPARRLRRQFGGYLQRLAAKNETASFFGPITYAEFTREPRPGDREPVTGPPLVRRAWLAHWAVLAVAAAVAADPALRPHLRPRRSGLLSGVDAGAPHLGGRPLALDPAALRLVRDVDGTRSVAELAARLDLPGAQEAVAGLVRRGVLLLDSRPPITEPDALGWLTGRVRALPAGAGADRWLPVLDRLAALLAAFGAAGLDRRRELLAELEGAVAAVSDQPVRRGGGEWYADRLVVHEECLGPFGPLPLGRALRAGLTRRLAPALTLLGTEAVARHRALTAAFLARHPQLAAGDPVPLVELLRADVRSGPPPVPAVRGPQGRYVAARIAAADPVAPLVLEPAELPAGDLGDDPLVASPDLMFASTALADDGGAPLVLAECHDTLLLWGWALQFHPAEDQVRAAGAELLRRAQAGRPLATVPGSRRAKIVPFDFPGPVVDLGASPVPAGRQRVPLADVEVRLSAGRLVCSAPGIDRFLLHHGELDSPVHNVLAPPKLGPVVLGDGARQPRVVLGDVVVQRARWSLPRDEVFPAGSRPPEPVAALRHARSAATRHGLPRRTFLSVPGERKPVLLDLHVPALLDLGWRLSASAQRVTLTELLPGPEQLWLRGPGGRHCAELRTSVVLDRVGGPDPAEPG